MEKVDELKTKLLKTKQGLGLEKVLVLFDLHCPFHREEKIIEIIKKHRHEIVSIIIGGDVMDCEDISAFPKEVRKPLIEESIITYKFLNRISKLVPHAKIYLIWGNHEYRFKTYLNKNDGILNPFHSDNILEEIVTGFEHHDRATRRKTIYPPLSNNIKVIDKWYIQYNDLIVAHPKKRPSKIPIRTGIWTAEYFLKRGFDFNACFIGHTHKMGNTFDFGGKWVGEVGCLCWNMEYADEGNIDYAEPQHYGYTIFAFNEGKIDINESKMYRLILPEINYDDWEEEVYE